LRGDVAADLLYVPNEFAAVRYSSSATPRKRGAIAFGQLRCQSALRAVVGGVENRREGKKLIAKRRKAFANPQLRWPAFRLQVRPAPSER